MTRQQVDPDSDNWSFKTAEEDQAKIEPEEQEDMLEPYVEA